MELVESADGTGIALDRSGSGPPLVIVMGASCDRSTSKPLAGLLASSWAAVVAAAGEAPFVYGHSSGGLLALETAARGIAMRRLAVYEPPYTGDHDPGPGFGRHLDELVATGRRDEAAEQWLAVTGTPAPIIESIKSSPGWAQRLALAHTLSQDLRLANNGRAPIERLKAIEIPLLVLAGGASPPWAATTTAMLAGSLPHAGERIVDGQQHLPADSVIAAILESFFR